EDTASACRKAGAEVVSGLADLGDLAQVNALVAKGVDVFGRIDVLVSSVAIRPHTKLLDVSVEEWRRVLDVDLNGTFYLCKAIAPGMVERRSGSIIGFGGLNAMTGSKGVAPCTAKHGMVGLIRSLALELAPYGVRANMV